MKAICTIITKSHLHFARVLHKSILRFIPNMQMHILIVDVSENEMPNSFEGQSIYSNEFITQSELGKKIYTKYFQKNMDHYRWSTKSVFMSNLLEKGVDHLLYLDSDLFFFDDPSFLFEMLNNNDVLLSPHFRCSDPSTDYNEYGRNNTHGLFNGGFVGANKEGIPALNWWAKTCHSVCEVNKKAGYYVDQSHLNMLPILFENIGIIRNHGCNVANWNILGSPRSQKNGELLLDGKDKLVFIHFTSDTIQGILNGEDPLLNPHLDKYEKALMEEKPSMRPFKIKKPWYQI
ncbi:glycosyltransferase [Ekhidna sp.]|uniref:glycosyltransferase n=1 Tax=Ekhidna sp. TaxID=2608089 RepID=UPI003C7BEC16